jgi:hypothetical protein
LRNFNLEAMMTRITRLKQEARGTATRMGHRLKRFKPMVITADPPAPSSRPAAAAICEILGAMVVVDPAPLVEGQAITGEGVNRQCVAIEQEGHETA